MIVAFFFNQNALAQNPVPFHGVVQSPESRSFLCSEQGGFRNRNCGDVAYEPQSIEGPKGFPAAGPADGHIASGGQARFAELNEQDVNRWYRVDINRGDNTFIWSLHATHATSSWRIFITRPDWNPNAPLTRAQFVLTPICSEEKQGAVPPTIVVLPCFIPPEYTGYHVILAVWDVADTPNAFYQVIDVQIH
ncbi:lytic polysaccharide monooxygenase [Martelella alba]|nr:lytic polysaccharide monooxygenase [Martelella alba]